MMRRQAFGILVSLVVVLATSACGDKGEEKDKATNNGVIKGAVTYTKTDAGTLYVSLDDIPDPTCNSGIPIKYAIAVDPVFPFAYNFEELDMGTYYVFAFFDIASDASPVCPTASDDCGNTGPVVLDTDAPEVTADLALDIFGCQQ